MLSEIVDLLLLRVEHDGPHMSSGRIDSDVIKQLLLLHSVHVGNPLVRMLADSHGGIVGLTTLNQHGLLLCD